MSQKINFEFAEWNKHNYERFFQNAMGSFLLHKFLLKTMSFILRFQIFESVTELSCKHKLKLETKNMTVKSKIFQGP